MRGNAGADVSVPDQDLVKEDNGRGLAPYSNRRVAVFL